MKLSRRQKQALHVAAREAGLNDDQRRMVQRAVGGFESAADDVPRHAFIAVMAHLEGLAGGALRGFTPGYWAGEAARATPEDALRVRARRLGHEAGMDDDAIDRFLAGPHLSDGQAACVAAASVAWLRKLVDALQAMREREAGHGQA